MAEYSEGSGEVPAFAPMKVDAECNRCGVCIPRSLHEFVTEKEDFSR